MGEHIEMTPDKCKACRRCEMACIAAHHGMSLKEAMQYKDSLTPRVKVIKAEGFKTSVRCHQCKSAPCSKVCPTGALQQDEDGRINMHQELCVACEMCIRTCPYGAISLGKITVSPADNDAGSCSYPGKTVAVRCDMCHAWRLESGKKITACMEACPVRGLYLVEADGNIVEMPAPVKKAVGANQDTEAK